MIAGHRLIPLLLAVAVCSLARAEEITLELLSEHNLPGGTRFEDSCIGGLSALYYDREDRYFALSDARRDARFYVVRIEIADSGGSGEPRIAGVEFESVTRLHSREGLPYPDGRVDPEGFALSGAGSAFVSSEGVASDGVPPFVDRIDVDTGKWLSTLPLPDAFRPRFEDGSQVAGVRNNLGLEALTLSPDRRSLYVASESALAQDAGGIVAGVEHFSRVLRFEVAEMPKLVDQALYPLTMPKGDIVVHGLVELLALDDDRHLLAMERTYGHDVGLKLDLYQVRFGEDRPDVDRSRLSPEAAELPVLDKQHILDFNQLPILLDNLEGLTFGPRLADGSETLLVVGDNDNTDCGPVTSLSQMRPTKFLLFRLRR